MSRLGSYEIVRDLSRLGATVVSTARQAGQDGEPRYAVKVHRPNTIIVGPEAAKRQIELFLQCADLQQRLASREESHWAAVHESGRCEGGTYAVSDLYPQTVQSLIDGHFAIDGHVLHRIVSGVAAGMVEIRDELGREHGNLKPGNVLLDRATDLERAGVLLCDPASAERLEGRDDKDDDPRALGELIYGLVRHAAFRALGGWPIESDESWRRLGEHAGGWLALCNDLLNPDRGPTDLTLDEIIERVASLKPTGSRRSRAPLVAALIAVVLVLGSAAGWFFFIRTPPEVIPKEWDDAAIERWQEYCTASDGWWQNLRIYVQEQFDETSADGVKWLDDPTLKAEVLDPLRKPEALKLEYDPRELGGDTDSPLSAQKLEPPQGAMTERAVGNVFKAHREMARVRDALADWSVLGTLSARADAYEGRGWLLPAKYLRTVTGSISGAVAGESDGKRLALDITEALNAEADVKQIQSSVALIERASEAIESTDPIMAGFAAWAFGKAESSGEYAGREDLKALRDDLAEPAALAQEVANFLDGAWQNVDEELFTTESEIHKRAEGGGPIDMNDALVRQWLDEASLDTYKKLDPADDPRDNWDAPQRLAKARSAIDAMPDDAILHDEMRRRKHDVVTETNTLRDQLANLTGLRWDHLRQSMIEQGVPALNGRLDALEKNIGDFQTIMAEDAGKYIDKLTQNNTIGSSATVDAFWRKQRDALLQQHANAVEDISTYLRLRTAAEQLEQNLLAISSTLPEGFSPTNSPDGMDTAALQLAVTTHRERVLGDVLSTIAAGGVLPKDAAEATEVRTRAGEYKKWLADLDALTGELASLEDRLDGLYRVDNDSAGQAAADLARQATGSAIYAAINGASIFSGVIDRWNAVEEVGAINDRARLAAMARRSAGEPAEVAMTAWRRLDDVTTTPWPGSEAELRAEADAQATITSIIDTLAEPNRKNELQHEIATIGHERFVRALRSARDQSELRSMLALAPRLAYETDRLGPTDRYNLALFALESNNDPKAKEPEDVARRRIEAFLAVVDANSAGLNAEALALADELRQLLVVDPNAPPALDFSDVGPGSVGWSDEPNEDGSVVTYTSPTGRSITFRLVEDGLPEPVYLAQTETSLALFRGVADDMGLWAELTDGGVWSDFDSRTLAKINATWNGPRVWQAVLDGSGGVRGLDVSESWLAQTSRMLTNSAYAPGLGDPAANGKVSRDQGPPNDADPMQHVSPKAAAIFAQSIGCRLPSPDEWQAALALEQSAGGSQRWNLRDQTWKKQYDYIKGLETQFAGQPLNMPFPDDGAYKPRGSGQGGSAQPTDDGVLWFSPVNQGPGVVFKHLVGNVAEFVADTTGTSPRFGVIGSSALSPPAMNTTEMDRMLKGYQTKNSYADAGFRLAFPGGNVRMTLSRQVARVLGDGRYVVGGG